MTTAPSSSEPTGFAALIRCHVQLEEAFLRHQEALLDFDYPGARVRLEDYRRRLALHMHHEEDLLMPLFQRIGEIKRWPAKLYYGEHGKMNNLLDKISAGLDRLCELEGPARRDLIRLLEIQTTYKHLCEHHHAREEQAFFPILDQVTSDEEKQDWLARIEAEWAALPPLA